MRDVLAERLLAVAVRWNAEDLAKELPDLQALAALKYDEYQQYSPGTRFVESLAIWLDQFKSEVDREQAYGFVRERLVFFSQAQMAHFVAVAYPDFIRPFLIRQVAQRRGTSEQHVVRIVRSDEFALLRRQTLFLGLSDGARIDLFRRSNQPEISHEQVWATYEIPDDKGAEMREKLGEDLRKILGRAPTSEERRFKIICLIDDFCGSGFSYLRRDECGSGFKGKIAKVFQSIDDGVLRVLVEPGDVRICVLLYVATERALAGIDVLKREVAGPSGPELNALVVQTLPEFICLQRDTEDSFTDLLKRYYDADLMDEHLAKGGGDVIYGFRDGGLPLVLGHNTPNNSLYILWAESKKVRALFPRVSRHRRDD